MWREALVAEELFLAGEKVPAGIYHQVGGGREIQFEHEDFLPASFDGRVATYRRVEYTWGQLTERSRGGRGAKIRN